MLSVLLSILTIMPKITNDKLEDECVGSDLLQFLKIICHQFTNNILTIDDQERIGFYEPHLQTPDSLPPSMRKQKGMLFLSLCPSVSLSISISKMWCESAAMPSLFGVERQRA